VWRRESQSQAETVKARSGKMKRIFVLSCIGLFILLVIPRIFPPNPSDEGMSGVVMPDTIN
jgi:hypothetical protein